MDIEKFNKQQFEDRKTDHIHLAMSLDNQTLGRSGLENVRLDHEALPELDLDEISLTSKYLGKTLQTPFYINSMTAGHKDAIPLNAMMAKLCQERGWMMGVGSQRRQLEEPKFQNEWKLLRKAAPKAVIIGNIGIAQLIQASIEDIERLVDSVEAQALFVHLNALQECIQPEGTPQFRGGKRAIERLCQKLSVPVIVKETGCGMSSKTLKNLKNLGLYAVDVSGLGGTHWGRIEGQRAGSESMHFECAKSFQNWGISTVQSLVNGLKLKTDYELWASGGVRTGLDAAKLLGLGAKAVGYAQPAMQKALQGEQQLQFWMETIEHELRVAMLCTGSKQIKHLKATV